VTRIGAARAILLRTGAVTELAFVAVALVVALVAGRHFSEPTRDALAALSALAMGMQNAVVRKLAVPDLTTTVLTMTLTGIAADLRAGNRGPVVVRRLLAVTSMLVGAVVGALLVLHASTATALGLAVVLLALVTAGAFAAARRRADWN
jgi:uncharacterized membrane protein YoaK (UPF0700 family)